VITGILDDKKITAISQAGNAQRPRANGLAANLEYKVGRKA